MSDLISKQEAIEAIKECAKVAHSNHEWDMEQGYINAIECLEELPSAQPERKKGEWIPQDFNKHNGMTSTVVYYYPKCSVCGHCGNYTNFCPNCGADMRGEELPFAQPEQRWIPCNERLPKEPFECLVTVWDTNPVTMDEFENILPYFVGWDGEQWNDADGEQCPFEVIAWMPLPKCYRGDD